MSLSRRQLLLDSARLVSVAALAGTAEVPFAAAAQSAAAPRAKLKIVVTGAHPGDPECGCGGTIAAYTEAQHDVSVLYLNRGDAYCGRTDTHECAAIRTAEAAKACALLNAHPVFAGQVDGRSTVDPAHYDEFSKVLLALRPDVVFTHWPIDAHRDHRALSALVLDAWLANEKKFALFYYEVAEDTLRFSATDFVNTSPFATRHHDACYAHDSQQPDKWYPLQVDIGRYYGMQNGWDQAEAFFRVSPAEGNWLPR